MRNTNSKNAERAQELNAIENIHVVEVDVTNGDQVKSAIESVIEKEGRIDVLVNNAGYYGGGIAESYTEQDVENMFDVNLKGVWRTTRAALPQMRQA